jgi:hypothetical protein
MVVHNLMRHILLFILTIFFAATYGQNFSYPSIQSQGITIADFIPVNWTLLDSATGDLNKDGIEDAVIILQYKDSITLVNRYEDSVLTQPRILLILFKNTSKNNYDLIKQNNSFVLNHDNSAMDDPYQGISVYKGIIKIEFHLFYNMGSWYMTNCNYKFRFDGNTFLLIGADLSTIHRATLDYEDYSYNFLTKKRIYSKGNDQKGTRKTTVKSVTNAKTMTIDNFVEPFTWEVENDIFL